MLENNVSKGAVITAVGGGAIFNTGGGLEIYASELAFNQVRAIAGPGSRADGGAIYNENVGQVTARDTIFLGNRATGGATGIVGAGGAIYNASGARLDMLRTVMDTNSADWSGGALVNIGQTSVRQSMFFYNESGTSGGAIDHAAGNLSIDQSSLVGNESGGNGGAIRSGSPLVLVNSTFSANRASIGGGALFNLTDDATVINVTVAKNMADSNGDGSGDGGGIWRLGGNVRLRNVLIAENVDNSSSATVYPDLSGGFVSEGHNLVGDGTGSSGLINGINGDQVGASGSPINPMIDVLASYSYPTPTHGLLSGSPAIDTGITIGCPSTDQRGTARPVGSDCDIGAVEVVYFVFLPLTVMN